MLLSFKLSLSILFTVMLLCINTAFAQTPEKEKRPINPLHISMRPVFPASISTKRQAIEYVLEPHGYTWVIQPESPILAHWGEQPIVTESHPERVITIETFLQELAGNDKHIVIDHEHKLLAIEPDFEHNAPPLPSSHSTTLKEDVRP